MASTVKGTILKGVVKIVKDKKGPEGLMQLEKKFGPLDFSGFRDYPTELNAKLRKTASEVVFGHYGEDTELEFGKNTFYTYAESLIGKTMFSLLGKDLKKVALGFPKILSTINTGLETEVKDLDAQKVSIRMKNNPYHIRYYEGVWRGAAEYFGKKNYKVISKEVAPHDHEYIIEWK